VALHALTLAAHARCGGGESRSAPRKIQL
jgi:hypothetical protein